MKNIKMQELKRWLKSSLKNKVSINDRTIITFLMAGLLGLSTVAYAGWYKMAIETTTGRVANDWDDKGHNTSSIIAPTFGNDEANHNRQVTNSVVWGINHAEGTKIKADKDQKYQIVMGIGSQSNMNSSVAIGDRAYTLLNKFGVTAGLGSDEGQGVAVGSALYATAQATAIGNNTYAIGRSSIAIGNDDTRAYENRVTEYDFNNYFRTLYANIDPSGNTYGYAPNGGGPEGNRKWSPTLAQGHGSIAIGSRSMAYADGTTALGTLAYALKQGSTAVGTLTRAEGIGAIAFGRKSNVFADNAIAAGNDTTVLKEGGTAYGLEAISGGTNSIAIGSHVYSNTEIDHNSKIFVKSVGNGGLVAAIETSLLGNKDYTANTEAVRGLYGFDLNGIARSVLGVATQTDPRFNGGKAGNYLKSGNYFVNYESYIAGIENALKNAYSNNTLTDGARTESIKVVKEEKNGVTNIARSSGDNAIVIGSRSGAFGTNGLALGRGAYSLGENSFAIGSYSFAKDKNALAIGIASRALGENSVAFGNGSGTDTTAKNSMTFGPGSVTYAPNSIILGINSRVWETANDSIVIGNEASTVGDTANNKKGHSGIRTLAIGNKTKASLDNSVALGYLSETDYTAEDLAKPGYTARGSYSIPSSSKVGIISVGKQGHERRIANVASGYRDSDAVTVSQLKTVEDKIRGVGEKDDNTTRYFSINKKNGEIGKLEQLGKREVNYKNYVQYLTQKLTVQARKTEGEVINEEEPSLKEMYKKVSELKADTSVSNKSSNVNALLSKVYTNPSVLFDTDTNNDVFNKKDGEATKYWDGTEFKIGEFLKDLDEAKEADLQEAAIAALYTNDEVAKLNDSNFLNKGAFGNNSIAIGYKAQTGEVSYQPTDLKHENPQVTGGANALAIGNESKALKDNTVALGNGAQSNTEGSIALGEGSITTGTTGTNGTLSKAGYDPATKTSHILENNENPVIWTPNRGEVAVGNGLTNTRRITGVAAGLEDTDAVNLAQLKRVIGGAGVKYFSVNETKPRDNGITTLGTENKDNTGASGAEGSIAIGVGAKSMVDGSVAIGYGAKNIEVAKNGNARPDNQKSSIAIGLDAQTTDSDAIALGQGSRASAGNTFALGKASKATANGAVAIGLISNASVENSVALGAASVADRGGNIYGYDPGIFANKTTGDVGAWKSGTYGAVSVGKPAATRQIINVAAGSEDTDAVNLAQLKNVTLRVNDGTNTQNVKLSENTLVIKGKDNEITSTVAKAGNNVTVTLGLVKGNLTEATNGMIAVTDGTGKLIGGNAIVDLKNDIKTKINSIGTGVIEANNTNTVTGGTVNAAITGMEFKVSNTENGTNGTVVKAKGGNVNIVGNADITSTVVAATNNTGANVKLVINKATSVTENDEKVVTSKAVHTAVSGARTTVVAETSNDYVTVNGGDEAGITGKTFTVGINKNNLARDFAKVDGSNFGTNKDRFRTNLEVYSKSEVDAKTFGLYGNDGNANKVTKTLGNEIAVEGDATAKTGSTNIYVSKKDDASGLKIQLGETLTGISTIKKDDKNSISLSTGEGENKTTTLKVGGKDLILTSTADKVKITGLATPEEGASGDTAVNKEYVDNLTSETANLKIGANLVDKAGAAVGTPDYTQGKSISLKDGGLNFKKDANDNITVAVDEKGNVTHSLSTTLNKIASIANEANSKIAFGTNKVDITAGNATATLSNGILTGITSLGKDGDNSVVFANQGNDKTATIKVNGKGAVFTESGNNVKLSGLTDGKIEANSTDAITGNQLNNLGVTTLGLSVNNNTGFTAPTFAKLKDATGADAAAPTTFKDAIDKNIDAINRGFKVAGNHYADGTDANNTQYLGSTTTIKAGNLTKADANSYKEKNLKTEYSYANGNGTVLIGLKENPEFKSVDFKNEPANGGTTKAGTIAVDDNGNVTVKHGDSTASKIATEKLVDDLTITYKNNGKGENDSTTPFTRKLTEGFDFVNGTNTTAVADKNGNVRYDLNSKLTGITSIANDTNKIELSKAGTGNDKNVVITLTDKELTISKDTAGNGISITGLADRDLKKNADNYGKDVNLTRAATEGALKALADTLGITPNDGATGNTGNTGNTGPAGKDGLNGASIISKVEALRDGTAGNVVYTKGDGTRLQKANDGNYYEADKVTKDGNKIVTGADGKKYADLGNNKYKEVDATGEIIANTPELDSANTPNLANPTQPDKVETSDIVLSTVNPDGTTTNPLTLRNIASVLGTDVTSKYGDTNGNVDANKTDAITKAKELVSGNNGLINKTSDLDKAVTLKDIQVLAIAGLEFGGNVGGAIHKPLGTKLEIIGKSGVQNFTGYSTSNVATNKTNDGKLEIGILKTPTFESVKLGTDTNSVSLTPSANGDTLTLANTTAGVNDNKVKLDGLATPTSDDGAATKKYVDDQIGGNNSLAYKATGTDGTTENGKDTVGLKAGLNFKSTTNITTAAAANGEVTHTLNSTLTGITEINKEADKGALKLTDNSATLESGKDKSNVTLTENSAVISSGKDAPKIEVKSGNNDVDKKIEFTTGTGKTVTIDNTGKLTGLADGTIGANSTDAVTGKQVHAIKEAGLKFGGNDALNATVKLGEKLNIIGEGTVAGTTAANNITVSTDDANDTLTVKLAKDLVNIDTITTNTTKNREKSVFSNKGLVASTLESNTGKNDAKETSVTSDGVEVVINTDKSKLTAQGLEMTDKDATNTEKKNVLNKGSITLTDTTGGSVVKNDTNTITASSSTISNKGGDTTTITADKISVANGDDKVEITKNSVMGATTIGKDEHNKITFGNGNGDAVSTTIKVGDKDLNIAKAADGNNGASGISITGLVDRDLNSTKYGVDTNKNRAATEGALKALADTLGLNQPNNGNTGNTGPSGKDGLNGASIVSKVDALRDGTAGNVVYTKEDGTRLQKANDGKYYEADKVTKDGNKIVTAADGKKYADLGGGKYKEVENGEIKEGTAEVLEAALNGKTEPTEVASSDIILSTVNADGETTKPLTLQNIASALKLDNVNTNDPANSTAITPEKAKEAMTNLLGKKGLDLNKAVTLADLQAVAQAGLDFGANSGADIHRTLGTKLSIVGNADVATEADKKVREAMNITAGDPITADKAADYATNLKSEIEKTHTNKNVVTVTNGNNEIVINIAKRPEFTGIDIKDPTKDGETIAINPDGMTVTKVEGKDPTTKTTTTKVGADGTTITRTDKTTDPNAPTTESAKYTVDGSEVKDKDGNKAIVKPTEIKLAKDGKDGANGKDAIVINSGSENPYKGPSIAFAKDGDNGTGTITGLADLSDGADGTSATNKNYVDSKIADANAGQPFEYYTKDTDEKVVRGRDGKLYKADELDKFKYNHNTGLYELKDPKVQPVPTLNEVEPSNVIVKAMPNTEAIAIGNVASGLDAEKVGAVKDPNGDKNATKEITVEIAKELVVGKENGSKGLNNLDKVSELNKVATIGDLKVLSLAGLDFGANAGADIHRTLGTKVSIVGNADVATEADKKVREAMNITAGDPITEDKAADYATNLKSEIEKTHTNKNVVTVTNNNNEIVINIAKRPEFTGIDIKDPTKDGETIAINPDGMTVTKVEGKDPTKTTTTKVGADGTTITRTDNTGNTPTTETAKYTVDGSEVKDKDGNKAIVKPTEIKLAKDGANGKDADSVVLKAADGNNGGSVAVGNKDGKETIKLDGGNGTDSPTLTVKDASGANSSVEIAGAKDADNLGKVSLKNLDGTKDLVTLSAGTNQSGPALTLKDSTGTENSVVIKGKDGANAPAIEFAKAADGTSGTGTITGLADLTDGSDGTSAANKNYVDSKIADANAGQPFEYYTTSVNPQTGKPDKVVRGRDGKLYKETELAKYKFVPNQNGEGGTYVAKDPQNTEALTEEKPENVVITAMPTEKPMSIGNVAAALGKEGTDVTSKYGATGANDTETAKYKADAIEKAKELVSGATGLVNNITDAELNKVVTLKDLQAVAISGLEFAGSKGSTHRTLGTTINIVGLEAQNGNFTESTFKLKNEADATVFSTKNIATNVEEGKITIGISEKPEFKEVNIVDGDDSTMKLAPTGTEIVSKDGDKYIKITTNKDGVTLTKYDNKDATIETNPTEKANYGLGGTEITKGDNKSTLTAENLTFGPKDNNAEDKTSTTIAKDGISVNGKDGKSDIEIKAGTDNTPATVALKGTDGKSDSVVLKASDGKDGGSVAVGNKDGKETIKLDGGNGTDSPTLTVKNNDGTKDSIAIKGADGTNGASIAFTKDGDNATGKITGLADIAPNEKDGSIAANKNYVDSKIKEATAGQPFEYAAKNDNSKVVRGLDGKLYKEDELKNYYYDEKTSTYKPRDPKNTEPLTELANTDVVVNLMPLGEGKAPIALGNIESILGKDSVNTPETAAAKVKDLIDNKDKLFENNKNKVATATDVLALAKAGIDFTGNTGAGEDIHRNLGEKVTIKGEGTDDKKDFSSATGNIRVDSNKDDATLTVRLSNSLKNMNSFETEEINATKENPNGIKSKTTLDKDGVRTLAKNLENPDKPEYILTETSENGFTITKSDNEDGKTDPKASANYGLNGSRLEDEAGNTYMTSPTETNIKDKDGNVNKTTSTDIVLGKDGKDGTVTPAVTITSGSPEDAATGKPATGPGVNFAIDENTGNGTGIISGLKDLEANSPGHYAANKNYVDDRFDKAQKGIDKAMSGVANALAVASIPQINSADNQKHNLGAAYGYYGGESAFALGLSGVNDKGNLIYKANVSLNTRGNVGIGAGIGYQFGTKAKDTSVVDTTKKDMALEKLNVQNDKLSKELNELKKELKDVKDMKANQDELYTLDGYNTGASELTDTQIDILKNIVNELNSNYKNRKIYITGYTDNVSNENLNLELGLSRASNVAKKLRELGLDTSISIRKVSSSGYNNIVETNKNSKGKFSNRRVEIELR